MKKKLLCAGLCLLALGFGVSWAGRLMGGSNQVTVNLFGRSMQAYSTPFGLGHSTWTRAEYAAEAAPTLDQGRYSADEMDMEPFRAVDIDLDVGDVSICSMEDANTYGLAMDWSGPNYEIRYRNEDGVLNIWSEGGVLPSGCSATVCIYLPMGTVLDDLDCQLSMGSIDLFEVGVAEADLTLNLGDLYSSAAFYGPLTIDADMGVVSLYGNHSDDVNIDADLGDVDLIGNFGGDVDIDASMGSVYLNGSFQGVIDVDADLGDVDLFLNDPPESYTWSLNVDMGEISVSDGDGRGFSQSSNSSITGGSGANKITVDADLGNIYLAFSQPSDSTAEYAG